ncbi:MAG: hypothetical protein WC124_02135 [Desulfoplanes sp.]
MKYVREYKMPLPVGSLHALLDESGNWHCETRGTPEWKPIEKSDEPVWVSNRKWDKISEKFGIEAELWAKFRKEIQTQERMLESKKEVPDEVEPRIKKAGENILRQGDIIKFLTKQAQKNHMGDADVIKHLLASIASTNSLTSSGIQPGITGERGGGKTDCARAVFHLISDDWKLDASVTAKIPFYLPMKDGIIIFSDDVEWSPELIHTLKRAMGRFQTRQKHLTLDTDRNPVEKEMAARIAWWLSSVESVADDQLSDRQYSLDVDDDVEHSKIVSSYLREARAQKKVRFTLDWRTGVARYIISKIKDHEPFRVLIPCAEKADWKIINDHRTQNKFWDLVEAFAILRFTQRPTDEDGWIYAMREDFDAAVALFTKRKANHQTHLTNAQTAIVGAVITLQLDPDGATQASIAKRLKKSQQAISKGLDAIIANTPLLIRTKGQHGEMIYEATVIGLEVLYKSGFVSLPDDYQDNLQPPYNPVTTILTTIKTTNSSNKNYTIQPNSQESKGEINSSIVGGGKNNSLYSQKIGCKVVKSSPNNGNGSCNEVVKGLKLLPDNDKICEECQKPVNALYDIGEGEFVMRFCKSCYDAYMEDISSI